MLSMVISAQYAVTFSVSLLLQSTRAGARLQQEVAARGAVLQLQAHQARAAQVLDAQRRLLRRAAALLRCSPAPPAARTMPACSVLETRLSSGAIQ